MTDATLDLANIVLNEQLGASVRRGVQSRRKDIIQVSHRMHSQHAAEIQDISINLASLNLPFLLRDLKPVIVSALAPSTPGVKAEKTIDLPLKEVPLLVCFGCLGNFGQFFDCGTDGNTATDPRESQNRPDGSKQRLKERHERPFLSSTLQNSDFPDGIGGLSFREERGSHDD
jgi:hypothetical protein